MAAASRRSWFGFSHQQLALLQQTAAPLILQDSPLPPSTCGPRPPTVASFLKLLQGRPGRGGFPEGPTGPRSRISATVGIPAYKQRTDYGGLTRSYPCISYKQDPSFTDKEPGPGGLSRAAEQPDGHFLSPFPAQQTTRCRHCREEQMAKPSGRPLRVRPAARHVPMSSAALAAVAQGFHGCPPGQWDLRGGPAPLAGVTHPFVYCLPSP